MSEDRKVKKLTSQKIQVKKRLKRVVLGLEGGVELEE